jgi:hypothetical protein
VEFEHDGQHVTEALVEQQQSSGNLLAHRRVAVGVGDAEVGAEHLEHRQVRDVPTMRHRVTFVDG